MGMLLRMNGASPPPAGGSAELIQDNQYGQFSADRRKAGVVWTLAAVLSVMVGVLAVAMALDHSGIRVSKPAQGAVIHDQAFQSALTNFDHEMVKPRPELFGIFSDGDIRVQNALAF